MYRVLTASEARAVEELAVAKQGVSLETLMRAAGAAVAAEMARRVPEGDLVVLAGPGNNGGDGWVAARELHDAGRVVRVFSVREPGKLPALAADAAGAAIEAGVQWSVPAVPPTADELAAAAGVIDALLGIGASGFLGEPLTAWVEAANASGSYLLSVDVPTGIDADTGRVDGAAIEADCTVTFTAAKRGLVVYPAAGNAGEVVVADIGIDPGLADIAAAPEIWTAEEYAALLPMPAPDVHKDSRGRVLVIAGSGSYPGAAVLAARGAARAGAGYVTLAVPHSVVPMAQAHLLSVPVVGLPQGKTQAFSSAAAGKLLQMAREYDAVVLGPGLTLADGAVATARSIVARTTLPLVIDADALNALVDAQDIIASRTAPTVLTPHPGELGRCCARADGRAAGSDRRLRVVCDRYHRGRPQRRGHGDQRRGAAGDQHVRFACPRHGWYGRCTRRHHRRAPRAGS